jgi:pSer/pThr/pTyr-binding forkhead associated (FHA) protein
MIDRGDLRYRLIVDGDAMPLESAVTIGRLLDNAIVIAGEDVLDFHLRIELAARGPIAIPLGDASLRINGRHFTTPAGCMPGDELEVGQSLLVLEVERLRPPEADAWRLCAPGDRDGMSITSALRVGRDPASELHLPDPHASRRHAQVVNVQGAIWVQDLASANGSFINGERIQGARRLFHGDEVRFDQRVYQLVGRGADLTPARFGDERDAAPLRLAPVEAPQRQATNTLEFDAVPRPGQATTAIRAPVTELAEPGVFLITAGGPEPGLRHRVAMGRTLIGRQDDCDLQLRDRSVSGHHAELVLRPEGATLTDLMSLNATLCNGGAAQSVRLHDGDRLTLGRATLIFRQVGSVRQAVGRRRMILGWLLASLLVIGAVALLL